MLLFSNQLYGALSYIVIGSQSRYQGFDCLENEVSFKIRRRDLATIQYKFSYIRCDNCSEL